jgi:hypothetical protein
MERVAAMQGIALRTRAAGRGEVAVRAATAPALLGPPAAGVSVADPSAGVAALAHVGGAVWSVRAGRATLDAETGEAPELPARAAADVVATRDLAALVSPLTRASWVPHAPAQGRFDAGGWGIALPESRLPQGYARLLSLGVEASPPGKEGARAWRGPFGELWVGPGPGLVLASSPKLLDELEAPAEGELGAVHGPRLAAFCLRLARLLRDLPGAAPVADDARRAAPLLAAVRVARWRLRSTGGRILLEW